MKKLLVLCAVSMSLGCTTTKSDLKALCEAPAATPREPGETAEHYVDRIFATAAPKLTNADAVSAVGSLRVVGVAQKPDLLRTNAREAGLDECTLADVWEWEVVLKEPRPRPAEGVRLVFKPARGSIDLERGLSLAQSARARIDALKLKDTRIITARCPQKYWGCVAVETGSVDQANSIEAALTDTDETLSLERVESKPIHAGTL